MLAPRLPAAARNLPDDIREREVEDLFSKVGQRVGSWFERLFGRVPCRQRGCWGLTAPVPCFTGCSLLPVQLVLQLQYGKVLSIDMKAPVRPPAFAFVEFRCA